MGKWHSELPYNVELHRQHYPFGGLKLSFLSHLHRAYGALHRQHYPFGGLKLRFRLDFKTFLNVLHRQHYPFGGLKHNPTTALLKLPLKLHRQHYPFGGLKRKPFLPEPFHWPFVAPSALPLRGTETPDRLDCALCKIRCTVSTTPSGD